MIHGCDAAKGRVLSLVIKRSRAAAGAATGRRSFGCGKWRWTCPQGPPAAYLVAKPFQLPICDMPVCCPEPNAPNPLQDGIKLSPEASIPIEINHMVARPDGFSSSLSSFAGQVAL